MIRVGLAGLGFMGWIHWLAYQKTQDAKVVAICTPEPERRQGDWTGIKGNFGPAGEKVDLTGIQTYADFDEMLRNPSIDVVDLCLPPAMHADFIAKSAAAGKHVFSEKPLALNLEDCDRALKACEENNQQLLVGQVLPYFVEFQFLHEQVQSGKFGKLLGGNFKRVISDPTWLTHFYDPAVIGGPLFDLHVHDAHLIRLLFGVPISAESCGRMHGEVVDYCNSVFMFDDPSIAVTSTCGVIYQQGRPFQHGFEAHFEQATIQFEFSALAEPNPPELSPVKVLHEDGSIEFPELGDGDPVYAFEREIGEVARSLNSQEASPILNGQLARDAIQICELQANSVMQRYRRT